MTLSALSCNPHQIRETLKFRYCSQVSTNLLDAYPAPPKSTKSRLVRKLANIQATLGSELIVNQRRRTNSTLPMLNTTNSAQVIIPTLVRSSTEPTPRMSENQTTNVARPNEL